MANDLVDNKKLIGLTRQEVVSRLGAQPKTEYFKEFDLVYYLGPERGFISIDSEWLVLKLGTNGRVARATTARDYIDDSLVRRGINQKEMPILQKSFPPQSLAKKGREVLDAATVSRK